MKSMVVYRHESINIPNQSTNQVCDTIYILFVIFTHSYFLITSVRLFNLLLLSFGIGQYYIRLMCFIRFIQFIQLIQFSCHLIVYSSIASTVTQYLEVEWDLFQPTPPPPHHHHHHTHTHHAHAHTHTHTRDTIPTRLSGALPQNTILPQKFCTGKLLCNTIN